MRSRLVIVTGPTGTGKSALAIALADRMDVEVVNADAFQLYRGMDIGTAKVPVAQRRGIPHHLLDVLEVTERASVAVFQARARAIIEQILTAGRTPVLVGGSGLYVTAVIDEVTFPGTDPELRDRLLTELAELGPQTLHRRLAEQDPPAAAAILPSNGRRIARALEVIELTGRPFSATMPRPGPPRYDATLLALDRDTDVLDAALEQRVHTMLADGLVDEVTALVAAGLRESPTASRAVGYAQLLAALDGAGTVPDAVADTVTATRRLVRRQRSWLRRDERRRVLDADDPDLVGAAVAAILARP